MVQQQVRLCGGTCAVVQLEGAAATCVFCVLPMQLQSYGGGGDFGCC